MTVSDAEPPRLGEASLSDRKVWTPPEFVELKIWDETGPSEITPAGDNPTVKAFVAS